MPIFGWKNTISVYAKLFCTQSWRQVLFNRSAILLIINDTFSEWFISSLNGCGDIYGASVSTKYKSFGTDFNTSIDFLAVG